MRKGKQAEEGMREWGRHEERRMDMIASWKLRFEGRDKDKGSVEERGEGRFKQEKKKDMRGGRQGGRDGPEVQTKITSHSVF